MIEFVFVVLAYRNMDDLQELIDSISNRVNNYKIIIVNSFYDEASRKIAEKIALDNYCDFLNIENKGYSYGNNVGIEYAAKKYDFKYLIISNPDIVITEFPINATTLKGDIIAPCIIARSGKYQNPMIVKRSKEAEWLIYQGFKMKNSFLLYSGIGINKVSREINLKLNSKKKRYRIYCAHGSFLLLSKKAITRIGSRPYDENMFLFAEESVIAVKAQKCGLTTVYDKRIVVNHKEDGSMKLAGISVNKELSKSNIYYYEHYVMGEANV